MYCSDACVLLADVKIRCSGRCVLLTSATVSILRLPLGSAKKNKNLLILHIVALIIFVIELSGSGEPKLKPNKRNAAGGNFKKHLHVLSLYTLAVVCSSGWDSFVGRVSFRHFASQFGAQVTKSQSEKNNSTLAV